MCCRSEYQFNLDRKFEIHDDIEVLRRLGLMMNLDQAQCSSNDLQKAVRMVPSALESYVIRKCIVENLNEHIFSLSTLEQYNLNF